MASIKIEEEHKIRIFFAAPVLIQRGVGFTHNYWIYALKFDHKRPYQLPSDVLTKYL